jgi:anti-anti-sigma regulatory factor
MRFKIDTKEKFHVITLGESALADIIAAELSAVSTEHLQKEIKNVVLKLPATTDITETAAEELCRTQQKFYENNASFVICEMTSALEEKLDELQLLEVMNIAPTESEAWDIVQMEEIEREMMDDTEGVEFNSHGEE